ncbi:MAG: PQQ-binding-like beta-propeller repeat protein [Verrucomicrobiota bacterium]
MKTVALSLAVTFLLGASLQARTWTQASSGKKIDAELIKVEDGKAHLRLPNGNVGQVEILSLSLEDQEYISSLETKAVSTGDAGGNWPAFRGSKGDGISPDSGLLDQWPDDGPEKLWVFEDAGLGYSGMSVVDGKLFTMGTRDEEVYLICIDVSSGEELWATSFAEDDANGYNAGWGGGPRSTPSVSDGHVYGLGPKGTLACFDVAEGKKVWDVNLVDEFDGKWGGWGYSESPLIDGDKLLIGPGGSKSPVVALDKKTGKTIWTASDLEIGGGKAEYATNVITELNGKRQYLRLFNNKLVSLDAESGDLVFSVEWDGGGTPAVIPTPIIEGNQIYISSGYGVGSKLVEVSSSYEVTTLWESKVMKNKHGGVIKFGDHLYGSSEAVGLVCQDWKTGELVWNEKGQFYGSTDSIAIADGMIYCLNDQSGTLSLVNATPDGFEERGQFTLDPQSANRHPKGKVWTYPLVVGGKLYLRDQDTLVAYNVTD